MHQDDSNMFPEDYTVEDLSFVRELMEHHSHAIRDIYIMLAHLKMDGVQLRDLGLIVNVFNTCQLALNEATMWYDESLFEKYKQDDVKWKPTLNKD